MKTVKVEIEVDELVYEFYQKVGQQAGLPVERVMYDELFKLAGELSLNAIHTKEGQCDKKKAQTRKNNFAIFWPSPCKTALPGVKYTNA